jgi:hypothetical protein
MYAVMKTRELDRARPAVDGGDVAEALFLLEQSRRVAVAQRRLDELLEVRELVGTLSSRSDGAPRDATEQLALRVDADVRGFPADELRAAGIEPEPDRVGPLVASWKLRAAAGAPSPGKTGELVRAGTALEDGDLPSALFLLEQARRVAFAQRKLEELLEVYALVQVLGRRTGGRDRLASDQLAARVDADLRAFAREATG